MSDDAPLLFCFGLGYSAMIFARRLAARGWRIAGTRRDALAVDASRAAGIEAQVFDRGRPLADPAILGRARAILSSVPPDAVGDPVLDHHGADLAALGVSDAAPWLGYLSTTGVYGDAAGALVDETSPRRATSPRGLARIAAEDRWLALGAQVFRLAGIYGPGRSQIDALRAGTAKRVVKPGQVFSRIHVDDIASVLEASLARPAPGRVFNVADDEAAPPQDVVAHASALLGLDPPPEIPFEAAASILSPMALSFYADSKRVDNRRIKDELGVRLAHPTYREGLSACLSASGSTDGGSGAPPSGGR